MPAELAISSEETLILLDEAASRNIAIELHYMDAAGQLMVGRTRVLGMDDERIYLDMPQSIGKEVRYLCGQRVTAHVQMYGTRYEFNAIVSESRCPVQLNRAKRVEGMALWKPRMAQESQRRHDYRVSFTMVDPVNLLFHEATDPTGHSCLVTARRMQGRVANLSLGGVGVRVDVPPTDKFKIAQRWFLSFQLGDQKDNFLMLAELRHFRSILNDQASIIGFQFLQWPDRHELQRQQQRISRHLTEIQRRQKARG